MRKHLKTLTTALLLAGFTSSVVFAQARPLTCADFQRNPNGSWSALTPITLNGVSFGPGVSFTAGVSFGGIDLGAILNRQCSH